jgi:putative radical SAM enzyme (TIGR03279 family)
MTAPAAVPDRNYAGPITGVQPKSAAAALGIRAGDELLAVNGQPCEDVIDVQFYSAEPRLELLIRRDGQEITLRGSRRYGQELGIEFAHPTFDIDIRRCNNLCPFCFVLQTAPKMRRTLYIKDDDYRYSFLFGHFVTLTNLSAHDWQRIYDQHLSPLYVSVHATDTEIRRQCLRNPTAPDVMQQLRDLAAQGIEIHTQLVVTPGLNDSVIMRQSVHDLASLWPAVRSVSVVPVGLTQYHKYGLRAATQAEAADTLDQAALWQAEFRAKLGVGFAYLTDEWYLVANRELPDLSQYDGLALQENGLGMVRRFLDEWAQSRVKEVPQLAPRVRRLTLATATLFAPTLQIAADQLATEANLSVTVIPITNTRLGEGITVAGLLCGQDVIDQLQARASELGDVVLLPRLMFDHPDGVSLDDVRPQTIADTLKRPIALVDQMGDVLDVLNGRGALVFEPDSGLIRPIMRDGGWAVEKYL